MKIRNPNRLLAEHIREEIEKQQLNGDVYDGDFVLGVIMEWLSKNSAILTPIGVERDR